MEVSGCLGLISDIDCCPENLQWSAGGTFRAVYNYGPIVLVDLKTELARQANYLPLYAHAACTVTEFSSKNLIL